jgi:hypothetical protein
LLFAIDGKPITEIPRTRTDYFRAVKNTLGPNRTQEVQAEFDRMVDELPPDERSGKRTLNSSFLGSSLSPWHYPLGYLYDAAVQTAGGNTPEDEIKHQSGFSFGLFAWECIINRGEAWTLYNPNLPGDRNNDVMGKIYFEQ